MPGHCAPPHLSRVYMDMTMPGVQKPHCDPWLAAILCWTACSRPLASPIPSTVVTASPAVISSILVSTEGAKTISQ